MNLAKPRIDIGFATNNAPAALAFWQNEIGLPFDYTQPIRRGYKQHRHDLRGSILKINQVYEPLPDNPPSGYRELLIARDDIATPQPMIDPEGNRVVLVPKGLVMAPLSSAVLSTVKPASAGAASGIYGTTAQIANAAGVAAIGAVFFAIESSQSSRLALLAALALFALSIIACAAFLTWMRQVTG